MDGKITKKWLKYEIYEEFTRVWFTKESLRIKDLDIDLHKVQYIFEECSQQIAFKLFL